MAVTLTALLCALFESEIASTMKEESIRPLSSPVSICGKTISGWRAYKSERDIILHPKDFQPEKTTVWSFPERGTWATHTPHYRGNWSPQTARNIVSLYSKEGDVVLDPMVGGGTTPVECMLTGRNSISVDINPSAIFLTGDRLTLPECKMKELLKTTHKLFVGDTRNLSHIEDNSIDLLMVHPPYSNIIKYTGSENDLSTIDELDLFFDSFRLAISEYYRVLKNNSFCAILIGDTRKKGHFVSISTRIMLDFLRAGFVLKEEVIKLEWNCHSDRSCYYPNAGFLFIKHEHLFVFRKPDLKEGPLKTLKF